MIFQNILDGKNEYNDNNIINSITSFYYFVYN